MFLDQPRRCLSEEWGTTNLPLSMRLFVSRSASEVLIGGAGYGHSASDAAFGEFGPYQQVGVIWLDNVACTAASATIDECHSNGWGIHNCQNQEAVGLRCV